MTNELELSKKIKQINSSLAELIFSQKRTDLEEKITEKGQELKKILNEYLPTPLITEKKASIIIVTYNSAETIKNCLDAVRQNSSSEHEIIIIDNNSQDETKKILEFYTNQPKVKVVFAEKNLGFSAGVNLGIKKSVNEAVVLLNPDTIVTKYWLEKLLNVLYSNEEIAAVGPISNYAAGLQGLINNNIFFSEVISAEEMAKAVRILKKDLIIDTRLLIGFCLAIKRDKLDEVGLLPENMPLGLDDLFISWQLRENGYKLKIVLDTYIHHKGQVSFKAAGEKVVNQLEKQSIFVMANKLRNYYKEDKLIPPEIIWGINWYKTPPEKRFQEMFAKIPSEYPFFERLINIEKDKLLKNLLKNLKKIILVEEISFKLWKEDFVNYADISENDKQNVLIAKVESQKKQAFLKSVNDNKFTLLANFSTQIYQKYNHKNESKNPLTSFEIENRDIFIISKGISKEKIKPLISICVANSFSKSSLEKLISLLEKEKNLSPYFFEILVPETCSVKNETKIRIKYCKSEDQKDFSLNELILQGEGEWFYFLKENSLPASDLFEKLIITLISLDNPEISLQGRVIPAGEKKYIRRSHYYRQNFFNNNSFAPEFIFNNLCLAKSIIVSEKDLPFNELLISERLKKKRIRNLFLDDLICFEEKKRSLIEHFFLNQKSGRETVIGKKCLQARAFDKKSIQEIRKKKNILEAFRNSCSKDNLAKFPEEIKVTIIDNYFNLAFQQGLLEELNEDFDYQMTESPLVSIIMTTYNNEKTISAAIESILSQTYKNFELIIIDDGSSSKKVEEIVEKYLFDSRVRYFYQANRGIPAARNRGILEAKGKYIKFADADDLVLPFGIEVLIRSAEQEGRKYQLIYGDYIINWSFIDDYEFKKVPVTVSKPELYVKQLIGNSIAVGAVIIDRETVIELNLLDEMLNGTDDFDLWNRIFASYKNPVFKVPLTEFLPIYVYSIHGEQFSQNIETIRCYTDTSCLKLIERINPLEIQIDKIAEKMLKRGDTPYEAAIKLLNLSENSDKKNLIETAILENNRIFPDLFAVKEQKVESITELKDYVLKNNNFPSKIFKIFAQKNEKTFPILGQISKKLVDFEDYLILFFRTDLPLIPESSTCWINRNIDQLYINSQVGKKMLKKYRIFVDKAFVIPPFINHQIFKPATAALKLETEKSFRFIFRNHLTWQKGIDLLLEAYLREFSAKEDVCLIIIFDQIYDYELYAKVKKMVNEKNQAEILILEKSISKEQITELYRACDCYVAPLRFPNNDSYLLEAMACNLPVITTEGATDFCNQENSFLVSSDWQEDETIIIPGIEKANKFSFIEPDLNNLRKNLRKAQQKGEVLKKISNEGRNTALLYNQENTLLMMKKAGEELHKKPVIGRNPEFFKKRIIENGLRAFQEKKYQLAEEKMLELFFFSEVKENKTTESWLERLIFDRAFTEYKEDLQNYQKEYTNYLQKEAEKVNEKEDWVKIYQKILEIDRKNYLAWRQLGKNYYEKKEYQSAIKYLGNALSLKKEESLVKIIIDCLKNLGDENTLNKISSVYK